MIEFVVTFAIAIALVYHRGYRCGVDSTLRALIKLDRIKW
jgi:hypothetical protein